MVNGFQSNLGPITKLKGVTLSSREILRDDPVAKETFEQMMMILKFFRPTFDNLLFAIFAVGSQSVLTYATSHGLICGWDLRSSKLAWKLENDPAHGNVKLCLIEKA